MPPLDVLEEPVKVHLSLNVPDLPRAVAFYRVLFGVEPAKCHDDYAKFELDDPPVVFSLVPHPPGPGASLSHLGFRVASDDTIRAFRDRLEAAGVCTESQDGTTCGSAWQNKLWVRDPFGNVWDIHRVTEDLPPEAVRATAAGRVARVDTEPCVTPPAAAVVWEHTLTHPPPGRVPHADGTVDEVRLVGTFNADLADDGRAFLVAEAARVLKAGGKIVVHGLMADRPFPAGPPTLPGLAAVVSRVPVQAEPVAALTRAGFVGVQFTKYDKPWFTHDGVGLREVKLIAWQSGPAADGGGRMVLYKGPFARITADGGHAFERGRRTPVPAAVWEKLRHGPAAEQFVFFEPTGGTDIDRDC